jgi:hypothetical protein
MERWSVEHRAFAVETYFKNSHFSHHAATSDAELSEAITGMCWQQWTPPQRHIQ